MKDIDFDELDKAVSSVLETPKNDTPAPTPTVVIEPATPAAMPAAPVEAPASTEDAGVVAETPMEAAPQEPSKTPLAIKRRGQFMDVVHPSSDMTSKSEEGAPTQPSRSGATLQPISTTVEPGATPPASDTDQLGIPVEEPLAAAPDVAAEVPAEAATTSPAEQVTPDPLDVMETQEETKDAETSETPNIEDAPVAAVEPEAPLTEEQAPGTPFLADTKVDKRPLDAFSAEEVTAAESEAAAAVPSEEPMPPELQADVVAVEAATTEEAAAETAKEPVQAEVSPSDTETGTATSIPQQYTATETKTEDDHSIFDTKEYHQPLTPAKAKKGGLPGWLVALVVMILLGGLSAAGGYFWFYYGL